MLGLYFEVQRVKALARRMRRAAEARRLLARLRACGFGRLDEQGNYNDTRTKPQGKK